MEFIKYLKKNLTSWLITSTDRTYKESPQIQKEGFPLYSKNYFDMNVGLVIPEELFNIFIEQATKFDVVPSVRELQKHCKFVKSSNGTRVCAGGNIPTECKPEDCSRIICLKKYLERLTSKK